MAKKRTLPPRGQGIARDHVNVVRRAYRVGGSTAVRLPRALADAFGIEAGTPVRFKQLDTGILVEPAGDGDE